MKSTVNKHSIIVDGHKTGVCLEDAFWSCLKEIAQTQGMSVSQTVTEIEKSRQRGNLSSAIRLFVLDRVRSKKVGATVRNTAAPDKRRQLRGGRMLTAALVNSLRPRAFPAHSLREP